VTQRALSAKLNESDTYIDKIERGVRRIDVVEFVNYATGLGLDPVTLFSEFVQTTYGGSVASGSGDETNNLASGTKTPPNST